MSRWFSLVTTAIGLVLLVVLIQRVGAGAVLAGVRQVGWGFLAIVAISGARILVRAAAWRLCLDEPDMRAVSLARAFGAGLCAEAIGSLTPLGLLASEPAKAAWVRQVVPFGRAMSAVAVENVLYSISVALVIASGTVALLLSFNLPQSVRYASEISLLFVAIAFAVLIAAFWLTARRRTVFSALADRIAAGRVAAGVRRFETRAHEAVRVSRGRLAPIALLEGLFHAGGIAEAYLTIWLLTGHAPTLLGAFVLETANRIVNVVFRFVPLRVGVDEAGTALMTNVLGLGTAAGVTLAVVRKARVLCWSGAGIVLMIRKGLSIRGIIGGELPEIRQS
jgi:lysylphosphatidylglycerol synthase-like protein